MRICIPTMNDQGLNAPVGEHFGRVPIYTIFDTDTEKIEILSNTSMHMGGGGYAPELLTNARIDVMLCSGLGQRAIGMFEEYGIMVYIGAYGTVRDAIQMWKEKRLQPATDGNACRKHAFRGEGVGYGHGDHLGGRYRGY